MSAISPAALKDLLAKDPNIALLDVRTPVEFATVHVTAAASIPLDKLDAKALLSSGKLQNEEQPVYLLCQSGKRAVKAAESLSQAGIKNPIVIEGGTQAWVDAGFAVTRGKNTISLKRQVRIAAGSLVLTGIILGYFVHHYFLGLSAFVGAGLIFAGITDWCGMGLLLAKAPWNRAPSA